MSVHAEVNKEPDGSRKVSLFGQATIEHIADALEPVRESVMSGSRVVLDLSEVEEADITLLQLVCSAHKGALSRGGLVIEGASPAVQRAASGAGFMHDLCGGAREEGCCLRKAIKGLR